MQMNSECNTPVHHFDFFKNLGAPGDRATPVFGNFDVGSGFGESQGEIPFPQSDIVFSTGTPAIQPDAACSSAHAPLPRQSPSLLLEESSAPRDVITIDAEEAEAVYYDPEADDYDADGNDISTPQSECTRSDQSELVEPPCGLTRAQNVQISNIRKVLVMDIIEWLSRTLGPNPGFGDMWPFYSSSGQPYPQGPGSERANIIRVLVPEFYNGVPLPQVDIYDPCIRELARCNVTSTGYRNFLNHVRKTESFKAPISVSLSSVIGFINDNKRNPQVRRKRVLQQVYESSSGLIVDPPCDTQTKRPRQSPTAVGSSSSPQTTSSSEIVSYGFAPAPPPPPLQPESSQVSLEVSVDEGYEIDKVGGHLLQRIEETKQAIVNTQNLVVNSAQKMAATGEMIIEKERQLAILKEKLAMETTEHDQLVSTEYKMQNVLKSLQKDIEVHEAKKSICVFCDQTCLTGIRVCLTCAHTSCSKCLKTEMEKLYVSAEDSGALMMCPGCVLDKPSRGEFARSVADAVPECAKGAIDPLLIREKSRFVGDALAKAIIDYQMSHECMIKAPPPAGTNVRTFRCPKCNHMAIGHTNYDLKVSRCANPDCALFFCTNKRCNSAAPYHFGKSCEDHQ